MQDKNEVMAAWTALAAARRARRAPPGVSPAAAIAERSGLQYLTDILNGHLPSAPVCHALNYLPVEFDEGRAVFLANPQLDQYNVTGTINGGYLCTVLDSAIGCAVQTTLPKGMAYTSLEIKVNFLSALRADSGPIRVEARVLHGGNRTGVAEAWAEDAGGRRYAHAIGSCLILALT